MLSPDHIIHRAVRQAHEAGQRVALDRAFSALGRSIVEPVLTKAHELALPQPAAPQHDHDPHAALLLAQLDHAIRCLERHRNPKPGDTALHALWHEPDALAGVVGSHLQSHPRVRKAIAYARYTKAAERAPKGGIQLPNVEGASTFYPGGQWIPAAVVAKLDAGQRKQLDAAKGAAAPGGGKKPVSGKESPAPAAPDHGSLRRKVAEIATDLLHKPNEHTPDKLRDLAEAVAAGTEANALTMNDLRALRLRLSAMFGDQKQIVAALLEHADAATNEDFAVAGEHPSSPNEPAEPPPAPVTPTPGEEPKPNTFALLSTDAVSVDPVRFQFKLRTDESGVTAELKQVKQFNPDFAGVISVWYEPETKKTWVVNGHHRLELARRTGYPHLMVHYLDAKDAREARAKGALVNIAEGRGTALDAAKFLRDSGRTGQDLFDLGVSPDGTVARDAAVLTQLNDSAFDRLARGALDVGTALAVAKHLADPQRQEKLFKLIARHEESGKEFTNRHVEEMARQMASAPSASTTTSTLWGDETSEDDTFVERADLASHVRGELAKEHHDYGALSSERRAGATAEAGNVLNVEENKKRAAEADVNRHAFDSLAHNKGAVSDALDRGAVALKTAKTKREKENARRETLAAVRAAVSDAAAGRQPAAPDEQQRRAADGRGMEGVGGVRAEGGEAERTPASPAGAGQAAEDGGGPRDAEAGLTPAVPLPRPAGAATQPSSPNEPASAASAVPAPTPLHALAHLAGNPDALRAESEQLAALAGKTKAQGGSLEYHDAMTAALRGEHGPEVRDAVSRGLDDWQSHQGSTAKRYARAAEEVAKIGQKPPEEQHGGEKAQPQAQAPETAPAEAKPEALKGNASIDLADPKALADAVHAAAKRVPSFSGGAYRPGAAHDRHKALIGTVYDRMAADGTLSPGTTLDAFKAALLKAHATGDLDLGRNDLPQVIPEDQRNQLERSQTKHPTGFGEFHVVNTPTREAAPPSESPSPLDSLAAGAVPREELQKTHHNMMKYQDLHEHGYSVSHWLNPSSPQDQVLEYNPRGTSELVKQPDGSLKEVKTPGKLPRLTAKNGDEVKAIHDALGIPTPEPRPVGPSRFDEEKGVVLSKREAKAKAKASGEPVQLPTVPAEDVPAALAGAATQPSSPNEPATNYAGDEHAYAVHEGRAITETPGQNRKERAAAHRAAEPPPAAPRRTLQARKSHVADLMGIPKGDSRFVAGHRVRRLADGEFQVERKGGFLTGSAKDVSEHIRGSWDAQEGYDSLPGALERAAKYDEPDPFTDVARSSEDARLRDEIPDGTRAVSLDDDTKGRVGVVKRDADTGSARLVLDGGEETKATDFEPLDAAHSWRAPEAERAARRPKGGKTGDLFGEADDKADEADVSASAPQAEKPALGKEKPKAAPARAEPAALFDNEKANLLNQGEEIAPLPEESDDALPSMANVKHIDQKRNGIRINAAGERGNEYYVTFTDGKYGQTVAARDGKHAKLLAADQRGADERAAKREGAPEPSLPNETASAPPATDLSSVPAKDVPAAIASEKPKQTVVDKAPPGGWKPEDKVGSPRPVKPPFPAPPKPAEEEPSADEAAPELPSPNAPSAAEKPPHVALSSTLAERLRSGALEKNELWKHADAAFGGTRAEGKYGPSEAYDALEAGLNKSFRGQTDPTADLPQAQEQARALEKIVNSLPTQTNRSGNKESHQQFSTPPHYSFAANWVANLKPGEHVLEPSAGTGNLTTHAQNAGAVVHANELDERRADFLRDQLEPANVYTENAEQIAGILPKKGVKPSVVVMNPPFSKAAGRMGDKKELMAGARHIEEAGKMLAPGGRLVSIVGGGSARGDPTRAAGMSPDSPTYKKWFADMAKKGFTLRANVGVSGDEYKKYGTTFGTRMLVFDKRPPAADDKPVLGDAADIPDLMAKLEGVRNDRTELAGEPPGEPVRGGTTEEARPPTGAEPAVGTGAGVAEAGAAEGVPVAGVPDGTAGVRGGTDGGKPGVGGESTDTGVRAVPKRGRKSAAGAGARPAAEGSPQPSVGEPAAPADGGGRGAGTRGEPVQQPATGELGRPAERIQVEPIASREADSEPTEVAGGEADQGGESLYENYRPSRMKIPGAKPHTSKLVETAAMAAVQPPIPTYRPHLSPDIVENAVRDVKTLDGKTIKKPIGLSEAGLESVVYAGQAHNQFLPVAEGEEPVRRAWFLGDGTGTGKGRQIAGIMIDNKNQGRGKHLWVTEKDKLLNDAKRDYADMGENPDDLVHWDKLSKGGFKQDNGVGFVTYSMLASGPRDETKPQNVDKLIDWLGKDFDGVVAFDESHNMGNGDDTPGPRGVVKASQQARSALKLMKALPKARIVFSSGTGATKVENLSYADRLGLWGRGTAFENKADFLQQMHQGGTSALESIAQSLKARGLYNARSLSYDGVKTDRLQHHLTDEQKYVYDNLAEGWQSVLQHIDKAIEAIAGGKENVRHAGRAISSAKSQFQGAQQRFFSQIITSMMVPTLIKNMEKDLAEGRSPVVQLTKTMASALDKQLKNRDEGEDLEDIDISPKQMLIDYLRKSFPVNRLQQQVDENDNVRMVPVVDASGNPVEDPDAVAMRDELIEKANDLKMPQSPLDQIVNHFGHENVAEATGRTVRLVNKPDERGVLRLTKEDRKPHLANESEARAFQAGKKKIMVFSDAGGTGASYHADKNAGNQGQRSHYLLQPGWRADKAVQGLGRTHRTNQTSAPIFHLMETPDIPGQKRFVSTIAKRLGQLGALTRGQASTGGGVELFNEADNLESNEAQDGLESFLNSVKRGGAVSGMGYEELMTKLGFKVDNDAGGGGARRVRGQSEVPEMRQFLNRVLALKLDDQKEVFHQLDAQIASQVEVAKQNGTLDTGVERYDARKIERRGDDQTVYRDPETGSEAKLVRAKVTRDNPRRSWDAAKKYKPVKFVRSRRSGRVWGVYDAAPTTDARNGNIISNYMLRGPSGEQRVQQWQIDGSNYSGSNYDELDEPTAKTQWEKDYSDLPATVDSDEHFVTGDMLAVWDKLPKDRPKIYRVNMHDGTSIVGRHVPSNMVESTLKAMGAASQGVEGAAHAPEDVHSRVLRGGEVATLANGWRVKRSRVGGESRIELDGPISMHRQTLQEDGVRVEKIASQLRYFIPSGEDGAKVLERVMRSRNAPVTEVRPAKAE